MSVDPKLVESADESLKRFDTFLNSVRPPEEESDRFPADDRSGRFARLVSALGNSAFNNYCILRKALDDDDQPSMAWSCRNLLDVLIFAKFVLKSKAHADDFIAERLADGLQIGESLRMLEFFLSPNRQASALDARIEQLNGKVSAEKVRRIRSLNVQELSAGVGLREDYDAINTLCSKLIQPTPWSLLSVDIKSERFPEARDIFFGCGAQYFLMVVSEIVTHIKQWGLAHKPDAVPQDGAKT